MSLTTRQLLALAIGIVGLSVLAGCITESRPLILAADVALNRYASRWYVIANIPYFAENGNVGS